MIELLNPTTKSLFGFAQRTKPALAALLILVHRPQFILLYPSGGGCTRTRPALDLKAGSELPT